MNDHPDLFSFFTQFQSALSRLILYRNIKKDAAVAAVSQAVDAYLDNTATHQLQAKHFHTAWRTLLDSAEFSQEILVGSAWQNHLLSLILNDDNPFSLKAGFADFAELSPALRYAVNQDLNHLQILHSLSLTDFRQALLHEGDTHTAADCQENWQDCRPALLSFPPFQAELRHRMKHSLHQAAIWTHEAPALARFYRQAGTGIFGCFKAFRWNSLESEHPLEGIAQPDPVSLDELIGYDLAREEVLNNTHNLLKGYHANNVLLYGDRGTGKSSTVKAILNSHAEQGLRLVEVPRSHLQDFPKIIALLKQYPQRFILFVDDLSFEDSEWNYKDLKAVLEGGLEVRPSNVVVYATSNRRHLIREKFSDRGTPRHQATGDEVHGDDTTQEKLSLADRFGITVTFTTPDQEKYLEIVAGLARLRGLDIDPGVLRRRALHWERWQNARSGRTARQFIDYLEANLALE